MAASWLDKLNPAQKEAVTYGDGPLLVIAGAGTGKTGTLACRVAWLIEKGVPPDRILLLTFTRRAAAEMLSRAGRLIGKAEGGAAGRVWGGTFHAVANRLLRLYGPAIGLPANFTVMDQGDAADMMNLIRSELGLAKGRKRFPRKETLVAIYSRTVNARDRLDHVLEVQFPWCEPDREGIAAIFDLYTQRKRQRNVVDYDDLLLLWSALCRVPRVGDAVADRFDHILVDEYQDTNAIQAEILLGMRKNRRNIMVVGDDAQSIYSFRAATIRNILDFPKQFPGTRIVTLEQNYRSTQPILAASNAVMAGAKERYTKELRSDRASDRKPVLITCRDEAEQCAAVCDNVMKHLEQGTPLRRQGVLFRAGHHSDQLEVELSRRRIPFHKYGGLKFIEAAHIKDMLAFLRILENPFDEVSWFRVLQLLDGVGPRSARRIMDLLGVRREAAPAPVASPLKRFIEEPPPAPAAAREQFDTLRAALADCTARGAAGGVRPKRKAKGSGARAPATPVTGDSAVPPVEDDTEPERPNEPPLAAQIERIRLFYEPVFERIYENPAMRVRDLEQLQQIAAGYRSRSSFITALTLDPPTSTSDLAQPPYLEEDYLVLSTIHSAKGCEWDVVHIIHAADGMIPSDMAVGDAAGIDEERRLLYVAMTRAKDMLYVYFPLRYYHARFAMGDRHSYAQLSRFLAGQTRKLFEERAASAARDDDFPGAARSMEDVEKWLQGLWKK
ncbi:MAG TPA: ATP-dependent helicase [Phycisphaerae bacterium]|nr:ATP-dependent helicase [Phycisphaerae bacterium]